MKPLLIIPPCPRRWPALAELYAHEPPPRMADIEKRFTAPAEDAQDAFAVIPDGGRMLSGAFISKSGDTGVLAMLYTRPEHRKRGYAARLVTTLIEWFDLTGGKRLSLIAPADVASGVFEKHAFKAVRQFATDDGQQVSMMRIAAGAKDKEAEGEGR